MRRSTEEDNVAEKTTEVVSNFRVTGYGVPKNKPAKRVPVKPDDLPKEVTEWLESAQQLKKP